MQLRSYSRRTDREGMADPVHGKEGFHSPPARRTEEEVPEVQPLHPPVVTEPFDRATMAPRTPMMEEPQNSPVMPVLTPQPQEGIFTQNPHRKRKTPNPRLEALHWRLPSPRLSHG